jgi:hypothetical protein
MSVIVIMACHSKIINIIFISKNCMCFINENLWNLRQKCKWSLWIRHLIGICHSPGEEAALCKALRRIKKLKRSKKCLQFKKKSICY